MSASNNNKTVHFNVGGTLYEVSRSLLDQHPDTMLARIASDAWNPVVNSGSKSDVEHGTKSSPIFIERDGERFKFCLDYMRDDCVLLPHTIPKDTFLQDLTYYGFKDVDYDAIEVDKALALYTTCMTAVDAAEAALNSHQQQCRKKLYLSKVAKVCLDHFKKGKGSLENIPCPTSSIEEWNWCVALRDEEETRTEFDEILHEIGWKFKSLANANCIRISLTFL